MEKYTLEQALERFNKKTKQQLERTFISNGVLFTTEGRGKKTVYTIEGYYNWNGVFGFEPKHKTATIKLLLFLDEVEETTLTKQHLGILFDASERSLAATSAILRESDFVETERVIKTGLQGYRMLTKRKKILTEKQKGFLLSELGGEFHFDRELLKELEENNYKIVPQEIEYDPIYDTDLHKLYFIIENHTENIVYIGITNDINKRYKDHFYHQNEANKPLYEYMNKLGVGCFRMEVRACHPSREFILEMEKQLIMYSPLLLNVVHNSIV